MARNAHIGNHSIQLTDPRRAWSLPAIGCVSRILQTLLLSMLCGCWMVATSQAQELSSDVDAAAKFLENISVAHEHRIDPLMVFPEPELDFNEAYISLWMKALEHKEVDLRRELIANFTLVHGKGHYDLSRFTDQFVALLNDTNNLTLRVSLAQLLITMDAKSAADSLFEHLETSDTGYAVIVEPALAKWNFNPAIPMWRERLKDRLTPRARRHLAYRCLATINDTASADQLVAVAVNGRAQSGDQFAAATAAGQLFDQYIKTAQALAARTSIVDQICAVKLLSSSTGKSPAAILEKLCMGKTQSVAGIALERLLKIDKPRAAKMARNLITSTDSKVRQLSVQALLETPDQQGIELLGPALGDVHPDVRNQARAAMFRLAKKNDDFDAAVRTAAMVAIDGDNWRILEQACQLVGALDHEPAADRLVELMRLQNAPHAIKDDRGEYLPYDRPETRIAVGWALRKLAVQSTLQPMLQQATSITNAAKSGTGVRPGDQEQLSHLFEALGVMNFQAADSLMRRFVSDKSFEPITRAAAIWSLGKLHVNDPEPKLTAALVARILDQGSRPPEVQEVHEMSAIALGRMQAMDSRKQLESFTVAGRPPTERFSYACCWAIEKLGGRKFPAPVAGKKRMTGFNLEPHVAK